MDTISMRTIEKNGITYTIKHVYDNDPDLSHYGTLTTFNQYGAIPVPDTRTWGRLYFVPGMSFRDHMLDWEQYWISERWARIMASRYIMQDMKRVLDFERERWYCIGIIVTANKDNVEIYRTAVFGVESDDLDNITEVDQHLLAEAESNLLPSLDRQIGDLRNKLSALVALRIEIVGNQRR